MLGLGDIVIPGILIALLLRFDENVSNTRPMSHQWLIINNLRIQRKSGSSKYFITTFIAYILGLAGTIVVMHVFKHAQPALLYLVPACLGAPLLLALFRWISYLLTFMWPLTFSGELGALFEYNEEEEEEEEEEEDQKKDK